MFKNLMMFITFWGLNLGLTNIEDVEQDRNNDIKFIDDKKKIISTKKVT